MKRFVFLLCVALCLCCALLVGCGNEPADPGFTQVVNPIVEVNSAQEMEERLSYPIPLLEKEVEVYIVMVIDGKAESGRVRYADGADFNIKKGTGDISGIYGGVLCEQAVIGGITVSFYTFEDISYAIWEHNGFAYSLEGGETLKADVTALIEG